LTWEERRLREDPSPRRLTAQAKAVDDRLVALIVVSLEIIEEPTTLADQLEQAAA
jgi:hypothetical protein